MRRPRRKLFRNLRGVGNFYTRKYVFQYTQQPLNLWFGGTAANRTLFGDFDLESLAALSQDGTAYLAEINAINSLFEYGRVSKGRIFWRTSGDKTNARYNLGPENVGTGPGDGVAASSLGNATGGVSGDFCGTYPRRSITAPFLPNLNQAPYSTAELAVENFSRVVNHKGFKQASLWAGSRAFIPSVMKQDITTYDFTTNLGSKELAQNTGYYPVYRKWWRTNMVPANFVAFTANEATLNQIRYQGINLSVPQVGCYTMVADATTPTTPLPTYGNGDYFTNVYLEIEIQWKNAISSLSNPAEAQNMRQTPAPAPPVNIPAALKSGMRTLTEHVDGPSLSKLGRFSEAADAVVSGMNILSRMKRD